MLSETERLGIKIEIGVGVKSITPINDQLELAFIADLHPPATFDKVIVAAGGSPKRSGLEWLEALGHNIKDPVPSLFTFNMPDESITELMGVAVENVSVNIQGTKLKSEGPLLLTHWGMSGPAILKLSAFGARSLSEMGYDFKVQINWVNETNHDIVKRELESISRDHPKKKAANIKPFALPERLWLYFLTKSDIAPDKPWGELGNKTLNKLVNFLTNDIYSVRGKTTFKEEFVTCGGVSLESIDLNTMESRECKNLYFAGEIMDIDAITGGYNFQAAWTTGFIAGKA